MFHYRDGLFFERCPDGSVKIFKEEPSYSSIAYTEVASIDPDGWASIVASVSKGGADDGRFYVASEFHDSNGPMSLLNKEYAP